jgi:hypothetical protein
VNLPQAQAIARIVHGAAQWSPFRADCLPRALVLCRLLARRGLRAEFRLGAGKPEGEFAAHAWVEHEKIVLAEAESPTARFAAFDKPSLRRGP